VPVVVVISIVKTISDFLSKAFSKGDLYTELIHNVGSHV